MQCIMYSEYSMSLRAVQYCSSTTDGPLCFEVRSGSVRSFDRTGPGSRTFYERTHVSASKRVAWPDEKVATIGHHGIASGQCISPPSFSTFFLESRIWSDWSEQLEACQ